MLNKDLQRMLQGFPDDMEVMFENGLWRVVTEVTSVQNCYPTTIKGRVNERIVFNNENVILLKGVMPIDYFIKSEEE